MKLFKKIIEIIVAWFNVITNRNKKIAKERYDVCKTCPHRMTLDFVDIELCNMCGCPLIAKTRSEKNSCDLKKWKR